MKLKRYAGDYFTVKKNIISFFLSCLVVTLHISASSYSLEGSSFGEVYFTIILLIKGFAKFAVPLFFILSAALFYQNYTYSQTGRKLKGRAKTLLIPYLFWNTVAVALEYIVSYSFISSFLGDRPRAEISVSSILKGVLLHEYSNELWFIFNIIVFALLCPIVYTLLKSKTVGIITIAAVYALYIFDIKLPEEFFYSASSIIYYLVGAYIGIHAFEWFKERASRRGLFVYAALLAASTVGVVWCYMIGTEPALKLQVPFLIVMALSFWKSFDFFKNEYYYGFTAESFLIYTMHVITLTAFNLVYEKLLFKSVYSAPIIFALTLASTIIFICVFAFLFGKFLPKIKKFVCGR